jgi:hypothetical protein
MELEIITPVAFDWDKDSDFDLVVGQEDGRVALIENTGFFRDGLPQFLPPRWFRQEADEVKFGALITPVSVDWDNDGDEDLIVGNTAGHIGFIENLDSGNPPKWGPPRYLQANGEVLRIQAGYHGSLQGPAEAKWGYTNLSVADWNGDGLLDLIVNSIWGKVVWYRNLGTKAKPRLAEARAVQIDWEGPPLKPAWNWWNPVGDELVTQWRTTPFVIDLTGDGLMDLVMLDYEGYLALFEKLEAGNDPVLRRGRRIFRSKDGRVYDKKNILQAGHSPTLRLNNGPAGKSGRRKFCLADWDQDGDLDLLVNSKNIDFMKNVAVNKGDFLFSNEGPVGEKILAGHNPSPTTVDWDRNGVPDLLVGAQDGFFYYLRNPWNASD